MRKIIHYVKEYEPRVKLLCGCRDGFIQHQGEEITCKRCIKSLKARGQPFRSSEQFKDPSQRDLFKHRERFVGMKRKVGKIVAMGVAWFKSKFGASKPIFGGAGIYTVPEDVALINVTLVGGAFSIVDDGQEIEIGYPAPEGENKNANV